MWGYIVSQVIDYITPSLPEERESYVGPTTIFINKKKLKNKKTFENMF